MGLFTRGDTKIESASGAEVEVSATTYVPDIPGGLQMAEVVRAAVGDLRSAGARRKWFKGKGSRPDWEEQLRDFDRNGPGFLGFYLDLISEYGSMCELEIQVWDAEKGWVEDESPAARDDLRTLRGPAESQQELVARMIRMFRMPGEMAWLPMEMAPIGVPDDSPEAQQLQRVYRLIPSWTMEEKKINGVRHYIVKDKPDGKLGDGATAIPESEFRRVYRPDPDYLLLHWTPLQRAIGDLRRFRSIARTIQRNASSRLLNADMMFFEGGSQDLAFKADPGENGSTGGQKKLGMLGESIKKMIEAGKSNLNDIGEDDVAAAFPHPFVGKSAPQIVKMGRKFDPAALDAKRDALEDFARGQNIPMSVLVEGQGAGARLLNNVKQDEAFKETSIFPDVVRVCDALSMVWLRPLMREDGRGPGAEDRRVWFSKAALAAEPAPADVAAAVGAGVLERKAWAQSLGKADMLLDLPEGVTEAEWLLTMKGSQRVFGELPATSDDVRERIARSSETASAWWIDPE